MIARFEELGPAQVRVMLQSGGFPPSFNVHAVEWLAERDREDQCRAEELRDEEMAIERSANALAEAANACAREANDIAREASASARRSAEAARTSNRIAMAALVAAVMAIAVAVTGLFLGH